MTSGSIRIDGVDIGKVTLSSLREQIGVVQQDVYLFSGTVLSNIIYGKPEATREEVTKSFSFCANLGSISPQALIDQTEHFYRQMTAG